MLTVSEQARQLGIDPATLKYRIKAYGRRKALKMGKPHHPPKRTTPKRAYEYHGLTYTPEYRIWESRKSLCYNPNVEQYEDYGGRGITMCDEWFYSFTAFYNAVGKRPKSNMTLERLDNNKGYEPGNVVWANRIAQANNRRDGISGTFQVQTPTGEVMNILNLNKFCRDKKLKYSSVHYTKRSQKPYEGYTILSGGREWRKK
jgi:hypothetical protein